VKVFSASQVREWDQYTILKEPVSSLQLMERAAQQCYNWIVENYHSADHFSIFCGKGNNGGDGLALARLLAKSGKTVQLHILEYGFPGTIDFQQNLARVHTCPTIQIQYIQDETHLNEIGPDCIVVDALFGSGINRPLEGLSAAVVRAINHSNNPVIAIDIPSGLFCDRSSKGFPIVKATHTLGFTPKLSFYLQENNTYVGQLHLLDIGLHRNYSLENSTRFELLTHEKISPLLKARELYSHKGNYGHALLIAGNIGKMGACVLAARGALRSGLGLLSCFVPVTENSILQTAVPEAMTITEKLNPLSFNSIAIGPGIGVGTTQVELLEELLNTYSKPIVMDADALTILSNHTHLLKKVPSLSIFTPHIGEFIRLFGETDNDFDRMELAIKKSKELNIIIILKGQHTLVATPFEPYFINTSGNPGMAKGGAGDVLTGVILGLLAQGYNSIEASIIGVYLHGIAGDLAAEMHTYYGMTTGDLIDSLGVAWKQLIVS